MHLVSIAAALCFAVTASANPVSLERRDTQYTLSTFTSLPGDLAGSSLVGGSNVVLGKDAGVTPYGGGIRLTLNRGGGGTAAVAPRGLNPGEAACTRVSFPGNDYSGIVLAFYSIESDSISYQRGQQDEIDFEFLGRTSRLQFNYFKKGAGNHEFTVYPGGKSNDLCIVNTGSVIRWYWNGNKAYERYDNLGKQWVWFTVWDTTGIWDCCGAPTAWSWSMDVQQYSVFTLGSSPAPGPGPAPSPNRPWPAENNCAASRDCSLDYSKFGIITSASGVSIQMYTGDKTFKPCYYAAPSSYVEFCLPKLQSGDKVAAYDNAGREIVLNWASKAPQGNYYQFRL
ncbi:hypothetical protein HDU96_004273 [Phlyctochytrium bullatum]|nr:hypothetical protein HDU96_004273 [Phlyctochytrium bullatum]